VIVVTDTSAILNLSLLGLQDLLPTLFGETHAPRAVLDEFLRLSLIDPRFAGLTFPAFIDIHHVSRIPPSLDTPRLDRGECEALSLALEIGADAVLMDERAGRAAAARHGINCLGLLGILIEAKRRNLIPLLAPYLERLQTQARFWFTPALRIQVLRLAGEIP
jgi:predicted nucleic acid-binding protein